MLNHTMTTERDKAARDILAFYLEAGVDALLVEEAIDRFAEPAPAPRAEAAPAPTAARAAPRLDRAPPTAPVPGINAPPPPDEAIMAAREAARSAKDLHALRAILDRF